MWFWVVTFGITGGLAFIIGLRRFQYAHEALENLHESKDYIDDVILAQDEGDIIDVEIVWKREK